MADVTPRNSPNSPFSGIPGPEIPRSPYRGTGIRGSRFGNGALVLQPLKTYSVEPEGLRRQSQRHQRVRPYVHGVFWCTEKSAHR
jgi:hypothetical protein